MSRKAAKRLLLVEDNPGDARLLREMFDEEGAGRIDITNVHEHGSSRGASVRAGRGYHSVGSRFARFAGTRCRATSPGGPRPAAPWSY